LLLKISKEHAEHLTILGLDYILKEKQKMFGKTFWYTVVFMMAILGTFWSFQVIISHFLHLAIFRLQFLTLQKTRNVLIRKFFN
jgi:hypothetical protein